MSGVAAVRAVLQLICGPIMLVGWMGAAPLAQEAAFDLVAPQVSASELDATTALPGQFSRALSLPFEQVCDAISKGEASASLEPVAPGACSSTSGKIFVQARSMDGAFNSFRFKLNTSVVDQAADLIALRSRFETLASVLSIVTPGPFQQAVGAGTDITCVRGPLQFQFWRERGDIPRFNLVVKIAMVNDQNFSIILQNCA